MQLLILNPQSHFHISSLYCRSPCSQGCQSKKNLLIHLCNIKSKSVTVKYIKEDPKNPQIIPLSDPSARPVAVQRQNLNVMHRPLSVPRARTPLLPSDLTPVALALHKQDRAAEVVVQGRGRGLPP